MPLGPRKMPIPPHSRVIHLTRDENRKLEWVAARHGQTAHAFAVALIRRELRNLPDPPSAAPPADEDE